MTAIWLFARTFWRPLLGAAAVLALLAWAVGAIRDYGASQFKAGRNDVIAANAIAAAALRAESDRHVTDAIVAGVKLHDQLDIALPKIEVETHDAIDKITTIYLARPGASVCVRAAGVQAELDAARDRANAAARGGM